MAQSGHQPGICTLDSADLIPGGDVAVALRYLQNLGLKVILVVDAKHEGAVRSELEDGEICEDQLLLVRSLVPSDRCDALRVAFQYNCAFAVPSSTRRCGSLEMPWTLPSQVQDWACSVAESLEVRYRFTHAESWVELPTAIERYLSQGCASEPEASANRAEFMTPCAKQEGIGNLKWSAGGSACVLTLGRGCRNERLLCIRCDEPTAGLFRTSVGLATGTLQVSGADLQESEVDDVVARALAARGGEWASSFILITATDGRFAGLRAIGIGSNKQKRRRAANLALAATAAYFDRCKQAGDWCASKDGEDLAQQEELKALVDAMVL
eukprot:TRINITY_DN36842_c0_g1_i2.p1 TRINITY_DN36842_c0_g1~~TRINITY_DN36842_c0_g1_i2.p1  ORF type:complete len:326 (+),score=62.44 TRINITY_DN36842_c0_g1_i2:88-1065(+)